MKQQIIQFVRYLQVERKYSPNTQQAYQRDLQQLLNFIGKHQVETWEDLRAEHLNLWIMQMRHTGINSRSIARRLSSVRSFLRYWFNQGLLSDNYALGLKTPKIIKNLPKTLTYEQLIQLSKPRSNTQAELRDVAIIETLYSCGLRVSELTALDVADIDRQQGFLSVMGKGGKMRHTPLGKAAQIAITNYLQDCNISQGAVFLSRKHQRITPRSVQIMIKKRALMVGIKINVYPHMLRHAAATHFLQSSHDLPCVQTFLGHESIKSTQIYSHLDFLELSKVYDKCHPRAKK